jgi:hypothetical protein
MGNNCIFHTLSQYVYKCLNSEQLLNAKRLSLQAMCDNNTRSEALRQVMNLTGIKTTTFMDEDKQQLECAKDVGNLGTIAAYSSVLRLNVKVHTNLGTVCIMHDESFETVQTYVAKVPGSNCYHMYLLHGNANVLAGKCFEKNVPGMTEVVRVHELEAKGEVKVLPTIMAGCNLWREMSTWAIGMNTQGNKREVESSESERQAKNQKIEPDFGNLLPVFQQAWKEKQLENEEEKERKKAYEEY